MQLNEFHQFLSGELAATGDGGEVKTIAREIIFHLFEELPPYPKNTKVSDVQKEKAAGMVQRLLLGEPLQYITGKALFLDFELFVNPSVLIPRPETAELVELIADETENEPSSIIDLGTGSGCLAIALAKKYPSANVSAADVSLDALETARLNALNQKVKIDLSWIDMNADEFLAEKKKFDLIVSNPPYISAGEELSMAASVLDHEPHLALFAPADDPLHFYRRIAAYSIQNLGENGAVWLEINPLYADETSTVFKRAGMKDVRIYADLSGKDRFIAAFN